MELMLSISLFVILAGGVAVPITGSYLNNLETAKLTQASQIFSESWEAVRSIRNQNWANLANQTYGLRDANGYWEFFGITDEADGFTRTIQVRSVFRDGSGNIVTSGGTDDSDSKWVKIQLSWQPTPYTSRLIEEEGLLTNYDSPGVWPPA